MRYDKLVTNNPTGYNEKRNFVGLFSQFVREKDVFSYCLSIMHKLTGKGYIPLLKGMFFRPFSSNKKKAYHFFNTINFGKGDWFVTFETMLPRLGEGRKWLHKVAIKKLASKNCKKIIALSDSAMELQLANLKENYPEYEASIASKMVVLHPSQKPLIENYQMKKLNKDKLVFTLIGAEFFRKGGREILNVFDNLVEKYPNIYLNIVSTMQYNDYATRTTKQDLFNAKQIINKYPDNIKHYPSLPNDQVLELMKETHVGILPTWGDSYGYSVLEAQAAGCPVITTDLRALPEINNNEIGWVIEVPKLKTKNADIDSEDKREVFQNNIEKNLTSILLEICESPSIIQVKGEKSLGKIKSQHDINAAREKLTQIYNAN